MLPATVNRTLNPCLYFNAPLTRTWRNGYYYDARENGLFIAGYLV